jgi:hypothetical protein
MLTKKIHNQIAAALAPEYSVETFDPKYNDVLDIWPADRSRGFIEVTVCHAAPDCVVLCPVDYDAPDQGLIEILNGDVHALKVQLDDFYAK